MDVESGSRKMKSMQKCLKPVFSQKTSREHLHWLQSKSEAFSYFIHNMSKHFPKESRVSWLGLGIVSILSIPILILLVPCARQATLQKKTHTTSLRALSDMLNVLNPTV